MQVEFDRPAIVVAASGFVAVADMGLGAEVAVAALEAARSRWAVDERAAAWPSFVVAVGQAFAATLLPT